MKVKKDKSAPEVSYRKGEFIASLALSLLTVVFVFSLIIIAVRWIIDSNNTFHDFLVQNAYALNSAIIVTLIGSAVSALRYRRIEKHHDRLLRSALRNIISGDYSAKDDTSDPICSDINTISQKFSELEAERDRVSKDNGLLISEKQKAVQRSLSARTDPMLIKKVFDSITKMAAEGRSEDIAALADDFAQVLTASVEDGADVVSLADELSRIKRYLEVQEIIDRKTYRCRMSIMCNIVNYNVLPNLILPVVQTMFDAAEYPSDYDYELCVEATSSPSNMVVILRDNSSNSLTDARTGEIITSLSELEESTSGLSIALLDHRITAYYGDKYGIKVSSTKLGNTVCIYLPPQSTEVFSS